MIHVAYSFISLMFLPDVVKHVCNSRASESSSDTSQQIVWRQSKVLRLFFLLTLSAHRTEIIYKTGIIQLPYLIKMKTG